MGLIEYFQLRNIREQQEHTNELLEQIRRQGLTPMERHKEDAERPSKDAARAQAEREAWKSRWGLCFLPF
jgi:hypothetical protein